MSERRSSGGSGNASGDAERGRKRPAASSPQSPSSDSDSSRSSTGEDDDRGHFKFELGENITPDYKIISVLGKGTFGVVLECWDRRRLQFCAIKVIRDIPKYRDAAEIEIYVLDDLRRADPQQRQPVIQLERSFDFRGHVCMVFPRLGPSVFDFLRKNDYRPFPLSHVVHMGRQLVQAVAFMHKNGIIHTDLKPENILLVRDEFRTENGSRRLLNPDIRLIDLGSATLEEAHHTSVVSTRHYRAPEVILGLGWSYPADVWSLACILIELYTGEALFQTHDDVEHMAMMERVLGKIPAEMKTKASNHARRYFDRNSLDLLWPMLAGRPESSPKYVNAMQPLREVVARNADLYDLLQQMMRYEPSARISACRVLEHPFFAATNYSSSSSSCEPQSRDGRR